MTKISPLGARAFPSLLRLALATPLVASLGCYAEPYCTVDGVVQGGFSGQVAWRGSSEDQCELRYDGGLEVTLGTDKLLFYQQGLGATEFAWAVGTYGDMRVVFESGGKSWSAEGCQVAVASVVREDWTQTDYLYITGTLGCPSLTSPDASPINLVGAVFSGYFLEDPY